MKTLLSLFTGGTLAKLIEYVCVALAIFFLGFALGQSNVTKTAIESVQTHADAQFAAATGQIAAQVKDANKRLVDDATRGRVADDNAVASLTAAKDQAAQGRADALAELARERAARAAQPIPTETAHACPQIQPFTFGPDARRLLDAAAGASPAQPSAPRDPNTETAGGVARVSRGAADLAGSPGQ